MAAGSLSITITIPVTGATDPNNVGREIANTMLNQAMQAIGGNAATSGNLVYGAGSPQAAVIGTWTFVAPT